MRPKTLLALSWLALGACMTTPSAPSPLGSCLQLPYLPDGSGAQCADFVGVDPSAAPRLCAGMFGDPSTTTWHPGRSCSVLAGAPSCVERGTDGSSAAVVWINVDQQTILANQCGILPHMCPLPGCTSEWRFGGI